MPASIQTAGPVLAPSIDVYRVVPAKIIADLSDEIAKRVFDMKAAVDGSKVLRVSELTGSLRFVDSEKIWKNTNPSSLPTSADQARKAAKKFVDTARLNIAKLKEPVCSKLRHLFPDFPEKAEHVQCAYAYEWDKNTPDHWLVRFSGTLSTGIVVPSPVGKIAPAHPIQLASADPGSLPIALGRLEELRGAREVESAAVQKADVVPVDGGVSTFELVQMERSLAWCHAGCPIWSRFTHRAFPLPSKKTNHRPPSQFSFTESEATMNHRNT